MPPRAEGDDDPILRPGERLRVETRMMDAAPAAPVGLWDEAVTAFNGSGMGKARNAWDAALEARSAAPGAPRKGEGRP